MCNVSRSVVSDSLQLHRLWPARLLCAWNAPGKSTGVGCDALLQEIFPTQRSNPGLLHYRQILYCLNLETPLNKFANGDNRKVCKYILIKDLLFVNSLPFVICSP